MMNLLTKLKCMVSDSVYAYLNHMYMSFANPHLYGFLSNVYLIDPFMPNGISYSYLLYQSIFIVRVAGGIFQFYSNLN